MAKVCILGVLLASVIVWCHASLLSHITSQHSFTQLLDSVDDGGLETLADLDVYIRKLRDVGRVQISKAFTAQTRRYRRELDMKSVMVNGTRSYQLDFSILSIPITTMAVVRGETRTFFIFATYRNGQQSIVEVSPHSYQELQYTQFQLTSPSSDPVDQIAAIEFMGNIFIALGSTASRIVTIACMDPNKLGDKVAVEVPQNIPVETLGDLHFFQLDDTLYLVVGEAGKRESVLYALQGKYFDRIEELRLLTRGVHTISGFGHSGYYYLILSMPAEAGSHIYRFDARLKTLDLIQRLVDPSVRQIMLYTDPHDQKLYLITLPKGANPRIYWWTREQLQVWQVLESTPLDHTASLGLISLNNLETIIFVSHGSHITFYTDDLSGHYFPTFTMQTSCGRISNFVSMKVGSKYVMAFLCHDSTTGRITLMARTLILHEVQLEEGEMQLDQLLGCFEDLGRELVVRKNDIDFLNHTITTDPAISPNQQIWEGPITFLGGLTVAGLSTFTSELTIRITGDDPTTVSVPEIARSITELEGKVNALVTESNEILYFGGNQTITGDVTTSSVTIDNAFFTSLAIHNLNGIPLPDYRHRFLLSGFDQVINSSVALDLLATDSLDLHASLNGIDINDLMRKSVRSQVVTGHHSYSTVKLGGIINPSNIDDSIIINGINTTTIVRHRGGGTTVFQGSKTFNSLSVMGTVNVGSINGIKIEDLAQLVIYKDIRQQHTLSGSYSLASVQVDGNVDVLGINGVDLKDLDATTVKTTGDFTLSGPIRYEGNVLVRGDLTVSTINGIRWNTLIDRTSSDLVVARFNFIAASVTQAIVSDDINGLDISKDVVLTDTNSTILGRVRFLSDVMVTGSSGVMVAPGVTVNNIDVSELMATNMPGFGGDIVVEDEAIFSQPLQITGDVTTTTLNGLVLEGITERYWRRSIDQEINQPVHIANAVFMAEVTGSSINGHKMTDFFTFDTNQIITGSYEFQGPVKVSGDLGLRPGSTVNGIDITALNNSVLRIHGTQTIHTPLESSSTITVRNLELAGLLNGIDVRKDYWRLDQTLPHSGFLSFVSKTVAQKVILNGDLMVTLLNGFDVVAAANNLVVSGEDAVITGGLQFAAPLTVTRLNVTGLIDGVDLGDLLNRALLKSGPHQVVSGAVVVMGAVHFSNQLSLATVNNRPWTQYLRDVVLISDTGVISGHKTFLSTVTVLGDFNPASINGIKVSDLTSHFLTLSTTQTIKAHHTFSSSIKIDNLTSPIIDGVPMDKILLTDRPGSLTGQTTFTDTLTIHGNLETGDRIPCDVSKLTNQSAVTPEGLQIYSDLHVENLTINGPVNSESPILVGKRPTVKLDKFLNTLVLKSKTQEITGQVQFLDKVKLKVANAETINNVKISELYRLSVLDDENTTIHCNLDFKKPLLVETLIVNGSVVGNDSDVVVNDINISRLNAEAVRLAGQNFVLTGRKTFAASLTVENLIINGSIGGVPVGEFVSVSGESVLQDVTFLNPITVLGDLKVGGFVDGVDLDKVFSSRVSLSRSQTIHGTCVFESIRILGDFEVDAINDVRISDFVLRSGQQRQIITGQKTYNGGLTIRGSLGTMIINGVNILELNSTVLRKDQNAVVNVSVVFENTVVGLGELSIDGGSGGVDLRNLSKIVFDFRETTVRQYNSLIDLHAQIADINTKNIYNARGLFVILDHLERGSHTKLSVHGDVMWVPRISVTDIHSTGYLGLTTCRITCTCQQQTFLHKLIEGGGVNPEPSQVLPAATYYLPAPALSLIFTLSTRCVGGVPVTKVSVETTGTTGGTQTEVEERLGLVADTGVFTVGRMAYVVTATSFAEIGNNQGNLNALNVIRYDTTTKVLTKIPQNETSNSGAVDLDLALINQKWYLIVGSQRGSTSRLFVWDNGIQQFKGVREILCEGARSVEFVAWQDDAGEEHHLLTMISNTPSRHTAHGELEDTTKLLVHMYDEETGEFNQFESVDAPGVVGQISLSIGSARYLILLSQAIDALFIFEYYPLEGFRKQQVVPLVYKGEAVAVAGVGDEAFVYVTTKVPQGVQTFRVIKKGVE